MNTFSVIGNKVEELHRLAGSWAALARELGDLAGSRIPVSTLKDLVTGRTKDPRVRLTSLIDELYLSKSQINRSGR